MTALLPLLAETGSQTWADLAGGAVVLLFAWMGSRFGLFMAVVWGLQALASVVAAFALLDWTDGMLVWAGMTNEFGEFWRQTIAFVTALAVVAIAIRLWIGASVEEGATNYPPLVDLAGGAAVGVVDGLIVVGILQVILQMAPLPERWAFDPKQSALHLGAGIIELVGQCAGGMAEEDREIMLDGEPGFRPDKLDAAPLAPAAVVDPSAPPVEKIELPQWSEVFADVNWNQTYDKGEKFLDADGDGQFTWVLKSNDRNTSKTRDIGLRERSKLGPWVTVRTLDKQLVQRLQRNGKLGQIVGIPWPPPGGFAPGVTAPPDGGAAAVAGPDQPPAAPPSPDPQPGPDAAGTPPQEPPAAVTGTPPGQPPTVPVPPGTPPAAPVRPARGTPPGVPKRPGQPAAAAPPVPTVPEAPPEESEPPTPEPEPEKPAPEPEPEPAEPPAPPPGPPSPFRPKK
ncbi:MAG: hypothetical protein ACKO5R_06835 [Planctomycetaceae bacterium]